MIPLAYEGVKLYQNSPYYKLRLSDMKKSHFRRILFIRASRYAEPAWVKTRSLRLGKCSVAIYHAFSRVFDLMQSRTVGLRTF